MTIPFYILDVFTDKKYAGNQLAVFENASNLTTEQMQQIASEINFAESTFITYFESKNAKATIRIFTPEFEMKFAGHPIIGSSWLIMNRLFETKPNQIELEVPLGKIKICQEKNIVWLRAAQPEFYSVFNKSDFISILNLKLSDFNDQFQIQEVSTGSPFVIVPINTAQALHKLELKPEEAKNWLTKNCKFNFKAFYFFSLENDKLHSRMLYFENGNLKEDAATGSASSCLQAYLLNYYKSELEITNHQGEILNRPSEIYFKGRLESAVFDINIGGKTQFVASGIWEI